MFSFVARQAIFDENMNTVGYELLFRDSMTNRFPDVTPEYATAQIIVEQFLGAPLGRLKEYSAIFVNFPYELLVQGMAETLPKDRVIVEIGVVCGRGRNPTLRLWPTIFSGKIDVFPGDRRSRLISSMTSVAPA